MELLEMIAKLMECEYISDLHMMEQHDENLHRCVNEISIDQFSEREWIDAVKYICNMECADAETARNVLLAF